jgi:ferredoxin
MILLTQSQLKERILSVFNAVREAGDIEVLPNDLIEFTSKGRVLIIGPAEQISAVLPSLAMLTVFVTDPAMNLSEPFAHPVQVVNQPIVELNGWLGEFNIQFETTQLKVDTVLDLSESSSFITSKVAPIGYYTTENIETALVEIPELIGSFDKPKFFNHKPAICAHSRRGVVACTQCLDACPADAITSEAGQIQVNPYLCQGCGSCTAVCPSGSMVYTLPSLEICLNRLRSMLSTYFSLTELTPTLLIHDSQTAEQLLADVDLADNTISFSIEEIGALGMPFWLSALAYGVGNVIVWDAGSHRDHDWQELQTEISKTNQLLTGLGYSDNLVRFSSYTQLTDLVAELTHADGLNLVIKANFAGIDDKRRIIQLALDHLHQQAAHQPELLALDNRAAFGSVEVDKQACTLCMSCVSVCPVGALLDGRDKPQLNFIEDLCVQCGMCDNACPEDAIELKPRYLFDREQARKTRLLNEEPVFNCISCGKPFATQKMIDIISTKLKDHPMFQGAAFERLKMCEDCRVKAMF